MDLDPADAVVSGGTPSSGEFIYWYDAGDSTTVVGEARIYYISSTASGLVITIDRVTGQSPRRATQLYTSSGVTITVSTTGNTFTHQKQLGLTWEEYQGDRFLGALINEQSQVSTSWNNFKPDPLGVQGISGVFQLNDDKYAVRDFWGGKFTAGAEEPSIGDEIEVTYGSVAGTFKALVAGTQLTSGSWEEADAEGIVYLYPGPATTTNMTYVDNWDAGTTITNNTTGNTLGTCLAQTGNVRQYKNKGLLWKLAATSYQGGWELVDTGYSLSFDGGAVAPTAELAPLVVTDQVDSIVDTGWSDFNTPRSEYPSTGTYSAWTGMANLDSPTDSTYASTTVGTEDWSRIMELPINTPIPGDSRILGLEVELTMHQTVGTDVEINKVQLRNSTTGATYYLSANRARNETLDTVAGTKYTFGSQLDLWELDEITQGDLNDGNYTVLFQVYNTNAASTRVVNIDMAQVKVHYAQKGQDVYFYDGSADVATATVYAYQVMDGDWSTDDAQGWMTLYNLSSVNSVVPGLQIRSAAAGAGELLAVSRTVSKNLLPSLEDMDNAQAIYQSRKATFSGEADAEAVFVATGASPAFTVDGEGRFSFIRLPIDRTKDIPRHVEAHRNHLMLATGSHVLVSSVGAPNNFNTGDGATMWNPKDKVTGLAAAASGSTMVACQDSIHLFTGSGATGQDAFQLKIITDNSGAREYTITNLLNNVYIDSAGLTTADISDKYGGFELGRRAPQAKPLFDELLRYDRSNSVTGTRLIGALPVRKKNQYRIYLSDGEILTATFPEDPRLPVEYTRQNYTAFYQGNIKGYEATFAPTAMDSSVNQDGEETILLGTRAGHVMVVDPGYMDVLSFLNKNTTGSARVEELVVWKPFKFLDISPVRAGDPSQGIKYLSAEVYLQHEGYTNLSRAAYTDYKILPEIPDPAAPELSVGNIVSIGDSEDYPGYLKDDYFSWYIDDATDGLCIRLSKFGGIGSHPTRINSMYLHVQQNSNRKDSIHRSHGYSIAPAFLPQDVYLDGEPVLTTAACATGGILYDLIVTGVSGTATAVGGTGTVSTTTPLWTMDSDSITLDDDTATFDGRYT
jgi:hypothetical protein